MTRKVLGFLIAPALGLFAMLATPGAGFVIRRRRGREAHESSSLHPPGQVLGRAGPRDQTLYFSVRMSPAPDGGYDLVAEGSLGRGSGHEQAGGGGLVLELASARKGWFVPFDTIRIRQERPAVEGRVQETVELLSKVKGHEVPFMKMEEEGLVYRPVRP